MSTSYYLLRDPITNIAITAYDDYDEIMLYVGTIWIGTLQITPENRPMISDLLFNRDTNWVAHTYYGGKERGPILEIQVGISPSEWCISEYGEITTIAELMNKYDTEHTHFRTKS